VRNALITMATDRSVPQPLTTYPFAAVLALSNWPADAKVTELFVKLVHDEKEKAIHPPAMVYLMRALPDDQKNPVFAAACKAGGTDHVWDLVGREALDTIKSVVTTTRDLTQAGIVETLCFATAMTGKPSLRAFAGEMGQRALQQPSADAQALDKIVKGLKKVGADAAPALPALKALKVEDANTAKAIADAIAEIEAKVAAVKEIKK
jgi:hypothetical protein